MKQRLVLFIALIAPALVFARDITKKRTIYWEVAEETVIEGLVENKLLTCSSCILDPLSQDLPQIIEFASISAGEKVSSVSFSDLKTEVLEGHKLTSEQLALIRATPDFVIDKGGESGNWKGIVRFIPLIKRNGRIEKVISYSLRITVVPDAQRRARNKAPNFASSSVLASGEWYKLGVDHDAVYKLSYAFLKKSGIDVDNIDPRSIAIFGNGGAMLPRLNSEPRLDDLTENAIYVEGESDGVFNKGDFILFYGSGPHNWQYDNGSGRYTHLIHQFSDTSYYFLRIGGTTGKRITSQAVTGTNPVNVDEFDDHKYHEVDKVNLLKSGDDWLGEVFDIQDEYTFSFSFANAVSNSNAWVNCRVATASRVSSNYTVTVPGKSFTIDARSASGGYGQRFAWGDGGETSFNPNGNTVSVTVKYNKPASLSSAKGWLDYIELNVRRRLVLTGTQLRFRDSESLGSNFARFTLGGANVRTRIWEVTDPLNPVLHQSTLNGGQLQFINDATTLREYVAVQDYDSSFFWRGQTNNQNLHSENSYNYVIVSHPRFLSAANRLKAIHEANGLSVFVVTPQMIYNEFSSGAQDIVGIRDFFRMLYFRGLGSADELNYVLFMGDGSYDNKYRIGGNTNFIPTFESNESFDPPVSYVSDDFYTLMDDNEGFWSPSSGELLDLAIGRIPCQTLDQANKVVDKIERYLSPQAMGDWRNRICFVADDEDGKIHMRDANRLSVIVDTLEPKYNLEKIYIDAFKQFSTPGGERYPDAQEAIRRQVERGVLILSYTGHGGEVGWAHERILTMDDINGWTNRNQLPLFLTATCEFSRWDDPQRAAGGEVSLLNPDGGGIALLTTVRLVYSFANQLLATAFYNSVFEEVNGEMPRLGDVYKYVKNNVLGENSRNFTLLGDPAMHLAYPRFNIVTDSINGKPISQIDTIKALSLMEVSGHLEDKGGNKLNQFNGTIYPTVFDKRYTVQTLNNDAIGPFEFEVQNKKLFKGKAAVNNGDFKFKFVVPKDIAYNFGEGRISYYGENQVDDASGFSNDFIVGGTNKNAPADDKGPDIELYMNDETFIYGGITDENPLFLARIYDANGINMTGTGIGHDITAILDDQSDEPIILNEYYAAAMNSYQEGEVNYPFEDLEPGPHKITLKVWDVYNNSSEAHLEFVVQEFKDLTIDKVLNYPNPFTTNTSFWFEHNQPNTVLDVKVQIFTVSGKIVKTIDKVIETSGYNQNLNNPISWNGRDEFGDKLGRGVYVYKLQVRSRRNGSTAEKIEKLVIL